MQQRALSKYGYLGLFSKRSGFRRQLMLLVLLVLIFGIVVTIINVYQLSMIQSEGYLRVPPEGRVDTYNTKPTVWINGKRLSSGYLQHVFNVFERLGYTYVTGDDQAMWDVLWAHDYPFTTLKPHLIKLKPHQKVNHFPGSGFLTNKLNLVSTASQLDFIPRAFQIPKDKEIFLQYAGINPDKKWVQKSSNHRGVIIRKIDELDLDKKGTFIQEFVDSPYLIDGRRFDIGIYTTITSINPLRVYIYEGDWLIRFCPEVFYPFDEKVVHKYVVTDSYMPVWKVPSLKKYYEDFGFTRKDALFAYLKKEGHDPEQLAQKLQEAIRTTVLNKEPKLIRSASNYKSSKNFFELVRFDFVLDNELNVYLMEVNMSPNLSSDHFALNRLLYEQVIFSMLSLVGIAKSTDYNFIQGTTQEREMQVSSRDVHTFVSLCSSAKCVDNCRAIECKLCQDCLKADQLDTLERSYLEHNNRLTWRRVVPKPFDSQEKARTWLRDQDDYYLKLSPANQWMAIWFYGKCLNDATWCM